jgi:hypothetical protein
VGPVFPFRRVAKLLPPDDIQSYALASINWLEATWRISENEVRRHNVPVDQLLMGL